MSHLLGRFGSITSHLLGCLSKGNKYRQARTLDGKTIHLQSLLFFPKSLYPQR